MKKLSLLGLLVYLMLLTTRPAHAYLDPGQGSLMLQALLGGTAALGLMARLALHRILDRFRSHKS